MWQYANTTGPFLGKLNRAVTVSKTLCWLDCLKKLHRLSVYPLLYHNTTIDTRMAYNILNFKNMIEHTFEEACRAGVIPRACCNQTRQHAALCRWLPDMVFDIRAHGSMFLSTVVWKSGDRGMIGKKKKKKKLHITARRVKTGASTALTVFTAVLT